jgi:Transposase DDE domain
MNINREQDFSADGLIQFVKEQFDFVPEHRDLSEVEISLSDALQSAYAMFALKSPSLLAFENQMDANPNLKSIFKIKRVPSDTQIRVILDEVSPSKLRQPFKKLFSKLQRAEILEKFQVLNGYYALSSDGTGYFSSKTIHCANCMEKKTRDGITYYHQMYGVSLIHPDKKEVIPLMPEPIIKQDGNSKNDCELNASKRFWTEFRREHPHLKAIAVEDSLYSKSPHLRLLNELNIRYIIGAKEGDHKHLFIQALNHRKQNKSIELTLKKNNKRHYFSAINNIELNESNSDLKVNFLEYWEFDDKKKKELHFTWITDFPLTSENVYEVMRIARARWKIENETFNTLKNQGYHFEHNFGHGNKNLSVVFAITMMLAFLTDQIQQLTYPLFQEALRVSKRKIYFWPRVQARFEMVKIKSMEELYKLIISKHKFEIEDMIINSS